MTTGPTLEHPLPDGVSDTFTHSCECGGTIEVVNSVPQPHDCPLTEDERQAIRDAAADDYAACTECTPDEPCAKHNPPEDDGPQQVAVDPLDLGRQLLLESFVELRKREQKSQTVNRAEKIALGHAFAAYSLAVAERAQYDLNQQMAQLAVNDRNAAIAKAAGPAGIVVPHVVPGRN